MASIALLLSATANKINTTTTPSPYAIHHSNNPTTVLITSLLTGDNYGSWCCAITMVLRAKRKFGFVDDSFLKSTNAAHAINWGHCNDLISSWILNFVSLEICPSILYADVASQI
ncbi:hypothetical protein E5676_scaffold299G00270 [Cucumis melo var. makuwa]|uniref:Retrotransposon Copia-like N-terminal domain-containing protein n=1 Tax=Cucumis melo var. makuwa TaxID=1194695 RepID=A0A5D3CNZ7_CUCMM|nr:hypothetical protein E5676_scaffold299G00270 [Cucumis melo var. makuwa]